MSICRKLWALAVGLGLTFAGAAFAAAPSVSVTATSASGNPGSTVQPVFSLDVSGFQFTSIDIYLSFADPVLTFDLGASLVTVNGSTQAWNTLPDFKTFIQPTVGDVASIRFSSLTLTPFTLTAPLVLQPAFIVRPAAPLGSTTVAISGLISEHPVLEEVDFASSTNVAVTAVPEPELWLMWLGGLGLLALRRARNPR